MTKVNEVLKQRIDINKAKPFKGVLDFQKAIQDGYVVDVANRGGSASKGFHVYVEMIKATPLEVTPVVEKADVDAPKEVPAPTTPRRNTAKKPTTEDAKEDAK